MIDKSDIKLKKKMTILKKFSIKGLQKRSTLAKNEKK